MIDLLRKTNAKYNLSNYWCFIQFRITKDNKQDNVDIYSNESKISKDIQDFILNSTEFQTIKPNDIPVDCSIYLCLFVEDGKINVPEYSWTPELGFNVMDLIPNN